MTDVNPSQNQTGSLPAMDDAQQAPVGEIDVDAPDDGICPGAIGGAPLGSGAIGG